MDITTYPPDDKKTISALLTRKGNRVIYKKEGQTRKEVPGTVAPSLLNESPFAISITENSELSTTSGKKVSEEDNGSGRKALKREDARKDPQTGKIAKNNNNGTKRALPKAEWDDMLARAYERGMGVKSQTGENSEANAAERDFGFPIDVIKTESPAPPTAIRRPPTAEGGLELSTNSIHQNKAIVNKNFLMAD